MEKTIKKNSSAIAGSPKSPCKVSEVGAPKESEGDHWKEIGKEGQQEMFDRFIESKTTPAQLVEWIAEANRIVLTSQKLTERDKKAAADFLWHLGWLFAPIFIQSNIKPTVVKDAFNGIFEEGYEYCKEGLSAVGTALMSVPGVSGHDTVVEYMRILSVLLGILEIYGDYKSYQKIVREAKRVA